MSSVHVPAIGPGEPAPCHPGRSLSGTAARCWCRQCGATYQNRAGEIVIGAAETGMTSAAALVAAEEDLVARREQVRARELELERATHVPEYRP